RGDHGQPLLVHLVDHLEEEVLLGLDVVVQAAFQHADPVGDLLQRSGLIAPLVEDLGGCFDQFGPALFPRLALRRRSASCQPCRVRHCFPRDRGERDRTPRDTNETYRVLDNSSWRGRRVSATRRTADPPVGTSPKKLMPARAERGDRTGRRSGRRARSARRPWPPTCAALTAVRLRTVRNGCVESQTEAPERPVVPSAPPTPRRPESASPFPFPTSRDRRSPPCHCPTPRRRCPSPRRPSTRPSSTW